MKTIMMLKPVKTFLFLFVFSANFVSGDEVCDEHNRIWNIITQSPAVQPAYHWLIHKGRIIRKDIWEKQQHPAYRYIPGWKAYEEIVSPKPEINTSPSPEPVYIKENKTYLPFNLTDNKNAMGAPPSDPQKEYIPLKIFHWHLEADNYDQNLDDRLERLLTNIEKHLQTEQLMPDIFAFTGTGTIISNKIKKSLSGYPKKLCEILWRHHFKKEPNCQACRMTLPRLAKKTMGRHNIFWTNHILIISMLPAQPLILPKYGRYEECPGPRKDSPSISSYMTLDVEYDGHIIPIMFFSSLNEIAHDRPVPWESWQGCGFVLRSDLNTIQPLDETMVIVSHINAPYYTYRDFARQWLAWVRNTDGRIEELSPALTKSFSENYKGRDHNDGRFSAILTYRRAREEMKQPARAHMAPDDIYLEPPGTWQQYLKWDGYSSFRPSYTVIEIDKAGHSRAVPSTSRVDDLELWQLIQESATY